MKKIKLFGYLALALLVGCQSNTTTKEKESTTSATPAPASQPVQGTMEKNGIKLTPVENSTEFNQAKLALKTPTNMEKLPSGNEVKFDFDVENYELGSQTPDLAQKMCANSKQGQHIHLILNNQPYTAYYTSEFSQKLPDNHYVGLAFLSRSYHESIKSPSAYQLFQFTVGKAPQVKIDLDAPHLFYSRPKGDYIGEDAKRVLLDFYLTNIDLNEKTRLKVRATINGTEFLLSKWQPYIMEGLPMGENKIKLELIELDGTVLEGPFNTVERTFNLYEKEPLKP